MSVLFYSGGSARVLAIIILLDSFGLDNVAVY